MPAPDPTSPPAAQSTAANTRVPTTPEEPYPKSRNAPVAPRYQTLEDVEAAVFAGRPIPFEGRPPEHRWTRVHALVLLGLAAYVGVVLVVNAIWPLAEPLLWLVIALFAGTGEGLALFYAWKDDRDRKTWWLRVDPTGVRFHLPSTHVPAPSERLFHEVMHGTKAFLWEATERVVATPFQRYAEALANEGRLNAWTPPVQEFSVDDFEDKLPWYVEFNEEGRDWGVVAFTWWDLRAFAGPLPGVLVAHLFECYHAAWPLVQAARAGEDPECDPPDPEVLAAYLARAGWEGEQDGSEELPHERAGLHPYFEALVAPLRARLRQWEFPGAY